MARIDQILPPKNKARKILHFMSRKQKNLIDYYVYKFRARSGLQNILPQRTNLVYLEEN